MVKYKQFDGATFEEIDCMQETIRNTAKCFGYTNGEMISFEHCYMILNLLHWKVSYLKGFSSGTRKHCMKSFLESVKMKVYYKMKVYHKRG